MSQMDEAYWDALASSYDRQVLSVVDHDIEGVLAAEVARASSPERIAADLGCGIGNFTDVLSEAFGTVHACDWSARSLEVARHRWGDRSNVQFHRLDLATDECPFPPVDFVFCVNVLIHASLDHRLRAWRAVTNQVAHGGTCLLVVPSFESLLYLDFRDLDWRLGEGLSCTDAVHLSSRKDDARHYGHGVVTQQDVPTKHYLKEELEVLFHQHEFEIESLRKLEFPWSSVFSPVLRRIEGPLTWAWLVVARRR